jgi:hypothetical protein
LSENLKGRDHLKDFGLDGRIILDWILNKVGGCGLDSSGLGYGPVVGSCEYGTKPSGSIKGGKFLI